MEIVIGTGQRLGRWFIKVGVSNKRLFAWAVIIVLGATALLVPLGLFMKPPPLSDQVPPPTSALISMSHKTFLPFVAKNPLPSPVVRLLYYIIRERQKVILIIATFASVTTVCSIVGWLVISSGIKGGELWQQIGGAIRHIAEKRHPLVVILILHVSLTLLYSFITPAFEAPDEVSHFRYMWFLARRHHLPVAQDLPGARALHPPLYYYLGSAVLSALHPFGVPQYKFDLHVDPRFWERWEANWLIHGSEEVFPYKGNARLNHLLRLTFVIIGALTVLFTYRTAAAAFPKNESLTVGAAAICAFLPQFTFMSGMVNNDNLAILLSSMAIFYLVRVLKRPSIASRNLIKLSLIVGLGMLTKYTCFFLIPLALVVILVKSEDRQQALKLSFLFLLVIGLVAGWYYYRNLVLYGDPLASKIRLSVDCTVAPKSITDPYFREVYFPEMYKSFVGNFGSMSIPLPRGIYYAFSLLLIGGGLGLLWLLLFPKVEENTLAPTQKYTVLILLLGIVLLLIGSIEFNLSYTSPQGRHLFSGLPAVSILAALGLSVFLRKVPWRKVLWVFLICLMLLLNLFSIFRCLLPAYYPFRPRGVRANLGRVITLIGYEVDKTRVEPGDDLELALFWQGQQKVDRDYTVFTHLLGESYNLASGNFLWGQKDNMPLDGTYPTSRWLESEVVVDKYAIAVQPDAPPGLYRIEVGMYLLETGQRLPVFDDQGQRMPEDRVLLEETIEVVPAQ